MTISLAQNAPKTSRSRIARVMSSSWRSHQWLFDRVILGVFPGALILSLGLTALTLFMVEWELIAQGAWDAAVAVLMPISILYVVLPLVIYLPIHKRRRLERFRFQRLSPQWGRACSSGDFEEYLRDQLSVAAELTFAEPCAPRVDAFLKYLGQLVGDHYARHEVGLSVSIPQGWEIPLSWTEKDGSFLYDHWIRVRTASVTAITITYQPFLSDATIVNIRPL